MSAAHGNAPGGAVARRVLLTTGMRTLVACLIIACAVGFFFSNKPAQNPPAPAAPTVAATAPREPSKYNMPKRALDRAADVKQQVLTQRKANEVP